MRTLAYARSWSTAHSLAFRIAPVRLTGAVPATISPSLTFGRQKLAYLGAGYPLTR